MRWVTVVFGSMFILFGAALFLGGVTLVRLGGSSYYVIVGIGLIASGIQLLRQRASGVWLYAIVVSGTLIWSPRRIGFVDLGPSSSPCDLCWIGSGLRCCARLDTATAWGHWPAMGPPAGRSGSRGRCLAVLGRYSDF